MLPDIDPRHGTNAGYLAGCRVTCCRTAHADYRRGLRARQYLNRGPLLVSPVGTHRRIQALMALGWPASDIDKAIGRCESYCSNLVRSRDVITTNTAQLIAEVYERLSMTVPTSDYLPRRQIISRTRSIARRRGYHPPLAWDDIDDPNEQPGRPLATDDQVDQVVIDRILNGDWRLPATTLERREVLRRWQTTGRADNHLERLTGWNVARDLRPHVPRQEAAA